jgi:hypothetical protein
VEAAVTFSVTVRVAIMDPGKAAPGAEDPTNVIVPVWDPTLNPVAFALIVTLSEALPDAPFVNPVGETSAEGDAESHATFGVVVHVRTEPGAPVFVIVTEPLPVPPVGALIGSGDGVTEIPAIGSQRMT